MRLLPVRTVSGRIVLGFLVLVATFGGVAGYSIYTTRQLGTELWYIRKSVEVSVLAANLLRIQAGLADYLGDSRLPLKGYVNTNRDARRNVTDELERKLIAAGMETDKIAGLRRQFEQNGALYDAYFAEPSGSETARTILARIKNAEDRAHNSVRNWFNQLGVRAAKTALRLERAEANVRIGAIVLGTIAALVALLVTIWAVVTLRPLRRLRESVKQIARGDYRQRIGMRGEDEIAEVAREFDTMAAAIEEREQELVRSERLAAVGKMAAVITHEIRNPLSSIGLHAELLEEELGKLSGGAGSEAATLCRAIHQEVDRLTGITEEYLRFARLPRPKLEAEPINPIVSGVLEFQREELALAGVKVLAELANGLPPVSADEAQLRQALLNLIRNAVDAMTSQGGGGSLTVATRRGPGGGIEVAVSDTGPGIPSQDLPRIFEPFFSTKDGGTGLGLALTQQIVVEHGGRLEVESALGRGTTFVVRLPAA